MRIGYIVERLEHFQYRVHEQWIFPKGARMKSDRVQAGDLEIFGISLQRDTDASRGLGLDCVIIDDRLFERAQYDDYLGGRVSELLMFLRPNLRSQGGTKFTQRKSD